MNLTSRLEFGQVCMRIRKNPVFENCSNKNNFSIIPPSVPWLIKSIVAFYFLTSFTKKIGPNMISIWNTLNMLMLLEVWMKMVDSTFGTSKAMNFPLSNHKHLQIKINFTEKEKIYTINMFWVEIQWWSWNPFFSIRISAKKSIITALMYKQEIFYQIRSD